MLKKIWQWFSPPKPLGDQPNKDLVYYPETGAIVDTKSGTMTEDYCFPCVDATPSSEKPKRKYTKKPKNLANEYREANPIKVSVKVSKEPLLEDGKGVVAPPKIVKGKVPKPQVKSPKGSKKEYNKASKSKGK